MLFNSYEYIFVFLPLSLLVYFFLNRLRLTVASKLFLVLASLFFYGWWNPVHIPWILSSIVWNFFIGNVLARRRDSQGGARWMLIIGIVGNLALLCYFKYMDFFISNLNSIADTNIGLFHLALPLGISFFTFTQIAYLVDSYKGIVTKQRADNYFLFVTFFPHLLAGPIIHHREMMPQFDRPRNKVVSYENISLGLYLFFMGLFKKVILADTLAIWVNTGFNDAAQLNFTRAWITSLSYTFQLYFDFSGYTDMAIGSSIMFNIKLPLNFNSPYKALDIQDFWRRWHITLSRFLRQYLYIPLGGNRISEERTLFNLFITFLIGGLWHGAGWTFILWGALHGTAMVLHRLWKKFQWNMPNLLAWFITFNFVNLAWIFFRAESISQAMQILKAMFGLDGIVLPRSWQHYLSFLEAAGVGFKGAAPKPEVLILIALSFFVVLRLRNSNELTDGFQPTRMNSLTTAALATCSIISLTRISEFIYFIF